MDLNILSERAMQVRARYAELETQRDGQPWTREDVAMGFVGDVGDLIKLVMAEAGRRVIPDARAKLEHELADCLWSVLVLARLYEIDLEAVFLRTLDDLDVHLNHLLAAPTAAGSTLDLNPPAAPARHADG